jgi:hypothetical protein
MPDATQEQSDREALMRSLAGRLEFAVRKIGDCFTLLRTVDVVPPVCAEGLTLNQATNLEIARSRMIDAVLNVAVFAALILCIVGFGTWAHRRP